MTQPRAGDVLVVEDDPDMAEVMVLALELAGYRARTAGNGREALAVVAARRPDLVLLDMLMPVMDGWACARELRALHGRQLPIVIVTAAEHLRARTQALDVDDVLPKPFDVAALLQLVARYARRSPYVEEPRAP